MAMATGGSGDDNELNSLRIVMKTIKAQIKAYQLFRGENSQMDMLLENVNIILQKENCARLSLCDCQCRCDCLTLKSHLQSGSGAGQNVHHYESQNGSELEKLRVGMNAIQNQGVAFRYFSSESSDLNLLIQNLDKIMEKCPLPSKASFTCESTAGSVASSTFSSNSESVQKIPIRVGLEITSEAVEEELSNCSCLACLPLSLTEDNDFRDIDSTKNLIMEERELEKLDENLETTDESGQNHRRSDLRSAAQNGPHYDNFKEAEVSTNGKHNTSQDYSEALTTNGPSRFERVSKNRITQIRATSSDAVSEPLVPSNPSKGKIPKNGKSRKRPTPADFYDTDRSDKKTNNKSHFKKPAKIPKKKLKSGFGGKAI